MTTHTTYMTLRRGLMVLALVCVSVFTMAQNVARIGETGYATLQAAVTAAESGATIELLANITETVANTTNSNSFTIDLGGHTWSYTKSESDFAALKQDCTGSVITLKNGTMTVTTNEGFNVWSRNGKVIIESGNYNVSTHEDYNIYTTVGYVDILGGTFTNSDNTAYTHNPSLHNLNLNVHNSASSVEHIRVYGGTFTADPSQGDDAQWGTSSFVATGYEVQGSGPYTVVKKIVDVEINLPAEATEEQRTTAAELAANTAAAESDIRTVLGDDGAQLEVTITGVGTETATFDVTPKNADGTTVTPGSAITFRLPVASTTKPYAGAYHDGTPMGCVSVQGATPYQYIELSSSTFSPFSYTLIDAPVAQIGTTQYATLAEAFAAAQAGETITMIADVTISSEDDRVWIKKQVTFDMDGHTLTSNIAEVLYVYGGGELTLAGNGTISGPVGATGAALDGRPLITVNGAYGTPASLTYLNGTLTCGGSGSDGMYGVYVLNGATATFGIEADHTGPTITSHFAAIGENNTTSPVNLTIYGGTYTATANPSESDWWYYYCAPLYLPANGTIAIHDGTFNGYYALVSYYSNVNQTLTIDGGTFNGSHEALLIGTASGSTSGTREVAVSGGTYSSALDPEVCAAGFAPKDNGDGTYGVGETVVKIGDKSYSSLQNAVKAAVASDEITLVKDITESVTNTNIASFTIDLNGHTWTAATGLVNLTQSATSGTITLVDNGTEGKVLADNSVANLSGAHAGIAVTGGLYSANPGSGNNYIATGYYTFANADGLYTLSNRLDMYDATNLSLLTFNTSKLIATATYTRNTGMIGAGGNLAGTKYGTLCLPFSIEAAPAGVTLYTATAISDTELTITEVTSYPVAAGTPLIFELAAAATTMTIESTDATIDLTTPATDPTADNLLVGTYTQKTITDGLESKYYLNGDHFHKAISSLTVPAYRAYMVYTPAGPAPERIAIRKAGESEQVATDILRTFSDTEIVSIFDLRGRPLDCLQKGINIVRLSDGTTVKIIR